MSLKVGAATAADVIDADYKLGPLVAGMDKNLHSPQRRLIELRMEHADLDSLIDRNADANPLDDLALRRLKKRRLLLRDQISRLEVELDPPEPA
jgi:hypothetical protein